MPWVCRIVGAGFRILWFGVLSVSGVSGLEYTILYVRCFTIIALSVHNCKLHLKFYSALCEISPGLPYALPIVPKPSMTEGLWLELERISGAKLSF